LLNFINALLKLLSDGLWLRKSIAVIALVFTFLAEFHSFAGWYDSIPHEFILVSKIQVLFGELVLHASEHVANVSCVGGEVGTVVILHGLVFVIN
jgi:hypothetical protein